MCYKFPSEQKDFYVASCENLLYSQIAFARKQCKNPLVIVQILTRVCILANVIYG
jgi:hypothetical protein